MATFGEFKQLESSLNLNTIKSPSGVPSSSISSAAGAISGVASAISTMFAGKTQRIGFEMQASARKAQAKRAISAAKLTNLKLRSRYNDITSNQAVTFAASGRSLSSGSIQNILREDQERLNWDLDFTELAGQAGAAGVEADVQGFEMAAKAAESGAKTRGLLQLVQTGLDLRKVK